MANPLANIIKLLPVIGPVVSAAPEFVAVFEDFMGMLNPVDQATAREALADLRADNDAGHARLQEKLAIAAGRG